MNFEVNRQNLRETRVVDPAAADGGSTATTACCIVETA
jgi:hypothetical protein